MSYTANISMTPPLTPPMEAKADNDFDSDSLDYMDFFNAEMDMSPVKVAEVVEPSDDSGLLHFDCKGEMRWTDHLCDTSCLGRRCLTQLLQQRTLPTAISLSTDMAFHLPCTADSIHCNLGHYFSCIREAICELERGAQSSVCLSQSCHDAQYPKIRQDIVKIFNILISHLQTLGSSANGHEDFLKILIAEILDLLLFVRPLHELQEHVTSAGSSRGNKSPSAAYHLLHLHLDIRWWSLTLLHTIEITRGRLALPTLHPRQSSILISEPVKAPNGGVADSDEESAFEQVVSLVVWDLITVMCRECLKKCVSNMHQIAAFSCTCLLELGVLILHILDHRHSSLGRQSFWEHIKNKILILMKLCSDSLGSGTTSSPSGVTSSSEQRFDIIQYPAPIAREIKLPHVWWIFTNFSRMYSFDDCGKQVPPKSVEIKNETKLLRTLVMCSFGESRNGSQATEVELRFFARSCLLLHHLWGGGKSSEWASPLWDFFSKHLDSTFLLPGAGLDGLACISKTAGGWLEQVKSRLPDPELVGQSESSWQIFLRIVVGVVQSGPIEWRQIRGRIYSKFHGRKMLELSPVGLHNSITLFLCLANTTDMVDVTSKLAELLAMTPTSNVGKSKVVWRGFLVTMLLLVEAGCSISPIAEKFTPYVTSACQEYITSRDALHKRDLGQLITLYAEGVQEIFEHSNDLTLSQQSLICSGLSSILPHCGVAEMKAVLLAIDMAMNKVLSHSESLHGLTVRAGVDIIETIWKEFGSFLKSQATMLTPPSVLGAVAASLTCCLAQQSQNNIDGHKEAASNLFMYFSSNEAVNVTCSQQYLYSLLSECHGINKISQVCPSYENHLISSWLSALVIVGDTEEVLAITPLMTSLPGVSEVMQRSQTCPFAAAKAFVKGVGNKFCQISNFGDRMQYRDVALQYFSSLDRSFGTLLKRLPLPEHLPSALDLFASVVLSCHSIIYVKSRPTCPLPSLISTIILPTHVYSPDKPLSPAFSSALAQHMSKVICGIGSISLAQDPYIIRCLKDIFTHYIYRFPVKSNKSCTNVIHPFIISLNDADMKEENLLELRSIFLEVVRDNYFEKSSVSHIHHQIVISLLLELLARSMGEWVSSIVTIILFPLLDLLLTLEDQITKRSATDFLQKLLLESEEQNSPPRKELVKIIRKFVLHHVSWSSHRLFRILGVIGVINRPLLIDCLPDIAHAVRTTEEKRGTGLDHTLRQGYQNLLTSIGVNEEDIKGNR